MLDLTNQRFGKLVARKPTGLRTNKHVVWECRCDCGNTVLITASELDTGRITSCGCDTDNRLEKNFEKHKTLIGQRVGKLVVLEATDQRKNGLLLWKCRCDCGNTVLTNAHLLESGGVRSCGCLRKDNARKVLEQHAKEMVGQRFGRLTVVGPTEKRRGRAVVWECRCDCGNTAYTLLSSLKNGGKKSCGCIIRERMEENRGKLEREMTGQRFGRLTVQGVSETRRGTSLLLDCLCDCGKTTLADRNQLLQGMKRSCGCLKDDYLKRIKKGRPDVEAGQRYGRLIVLHQSDERINNLLTWECKCDCGNTTQATAYQLTKGLKKSCGCLRKKIKLPDSIGNQDEILCE